MTVLALSPVVWVFAAAILLFLALVAVRYVFLLVRDASTLARDARIAAERLDAARGQVQAEVERAQDHLGTFTERGKDRSRRRSNPGV